MLETLRRLMFRSFWVVSGILRQAQTSVRGWFSKPQDEYPIDESGLLIRRFLAHQSWFDNLTASWHARSFLTQMTVISGVIVLSGLIGSLFNASFFLMLSVGFVSVLTHRLFIAHEANRRKGGEIFIEESRVLNQELVMSKAFFTEATATMNQVAENIKPNVIAMSDQTITLNLATETLVETHHKVITALNEIKSTSSQLVEQENRVQDSYKEMANGYREQTSVIQKTTQKVGEIATTVAAFSASVADFQQNKNNWVASFNQFDLFMKKPRETTGVDRSAVSNELMKQLTAELDENDQLIKVWALRDSALCMVH